MFCLELLLQVLFYNRDRIDQLWIMVCGCFVEILRNGREPTFLVECIVAGMLRLALRLLKRQQELATQVSLLMLKKRFADQTNRNFSFYLCRSSLVSLPSCKNAVPTSYVLIQTVYRHLQLQRLLLEPLPTAVFFTVINHRNSLMMAVPVAVELVQWLDRLSTVWTLC